MMQQFTYRFRLFYGLLFSLLLIIPMVTASGCGPADPEEGLDRVPNVPPSTRGDDAKPRVPASPR